MMFLGNNFASVCVLTCAILTTANERSSSSSSSHTMWLMKAILGDDTEAALQMIDTGDPRWFSLGEGMQTALMLAAYRGHVQLISNLLDRGSDPNTKHINGEGADGKTALHYALVGWNERQVNWITDQREHKHAATSTVQFNFTESIATLLSRGADPTIDGDRVILYAARIRNLKALQLMLGTEKDCSRLNPAGQTLVGGLTVGLFSLLTESTRWIKVFGHMSLSSEEGMSKRSVQLLRQRRAAALDEYGFTDYFDSRALSSQKTHKMMQALTISVRRWGSHGVGMIAGSCDELWVSQALQVKTKPSGDTALHLAAFDGDSDTITTLMSHGALATATNALEQTPLHLACLRGHKNATLALLDWGGVRGLQALDSYGRSPIEVATLDLKETLITVAGTQLQNNFHEDHSPGTQTIVEGDTTHACDFDTVNAESLTTTMFHQRYLSLSKPVRILNAVSDWLASLKWNLKYLRSALGTNLMHVSSIPYANNFGLHNEQATFADFMKLNENVDEPPYVFDGKVLRKTPKLLADLVTPKWFEGLRFNTPQLIVGAKNSGAPMHFHQAAWNALFHGEKEWSILRPDNLLMHHQHVGKQTDEPLQNIMHCTQPAGSIVFVPAGFSHSVVNTQHVIGVAVEIYN
eukprot:m.127641 g.127641  ORF g.127641 m.127641 type:complete len:636 (+) comp29289_c0_seq3:139-2046(+)